ncbi:uncharacterized protein LOC121367971 isoform X2 [Gigantopelta aegis]|uniref:uncharacterized protein LOC121367971 isoform X2 n=1 Tax=Gigantopelta aegis TaxID=1735272 RepID=UPI001B8879EB|nr:uncharacterized protein LOC121367971 isoform X2 [Gigantopelta aegis]
MSDKASVPTDSDLGLPVAAIVCLGLSGYIILIFIIIFVRNALVNRGTCTCESPCGAKEEADQNKCCSSASLAETCNCCQSPSIHSCVRAVCPQKKNVGLMDILLCQCCCGDDTTNVCSCIHLDMDYEVKNINCCCFTLHLIKNAQQQPLPYNYTNCPAQSGVNYSTNNSLKPMHSSFWRSFNKTHPFLEESQVPATDVSIPRLENEMQSAVPPVMTMEHDSMTYLTHKEAMPNVSLGSKRSSVNNERGATANENGSACKTKLDMDLRHNNGGKQSRDKRRRTRLSITNPYSARSSARPHFIHRKSRSCSPPTRM